MVCLSSISFAYDFQVDGFNFDFIGSSNEVVLRSPINPIDIVVIPSKVTFRNREFDVVSIGDNAFRDTKLYSVTFSEGLRSIGDNAFRNTLIDRVLLPNSNERIGEYAFADCPNLKVVQFGENLLCSRYWKTLMHTFTNDDSIETIIFTGNQAPMNLFYYPPFSNMTKQFCKVYVPINGYLNFIESELPKLFANKLIPYSPEGVETETVPYVKYFWNEDSISNKYVINGSRSVYSPYSGTKTYPLNLIIEECPIKGHILVRITIDAVLSQSDLDLGTKRVFYAIKSNKSDYTELEGENWFVSGGDEKPSKRRIIIKFTQVKTRSLFKSKLQDAVSIGYGEGDKLIFIITDISDNFKVEFKEAN